MIKFSLGNGYKLIISRNKKGNLIDTVNEFKYTMIHRYSDGLFMAKGFLSKQLLRDWPDSLNEFMISDCDHAHAYHQKKDE